jgi:hypothetical protein
MKIAGFIFYSPFSPKQPKHENRSKENPERPQNKTFAISSSHKNFSSLPLKPTQSVASQQLCHYGLSADMEKTHDISEKGSV